MLRCSKCLTRLDLVELCLNVVNGVTLVIPKIKRIDYFHVRGGRLLVYFPDHGSFVNRFSAKWAELEVWLVSQVIDKVVVAGLMELVRLVAFELYDMLSGLHQQITNTALADLLGAKRRINGATKLLLRPL